MSTSSSSGSGVGLTGILTIVFIVLKLVGVITWSWWWVLAPMWISASFAVFVLLMALLLYVVVGE